MAYNITNTTSGAVLSNAAIQNPATVAFNGSVTNTYSDAPHHLGDGIYGTNAAAWTITNYGTVNSNPAAGNGIELAAGGIVSNLDSTVSTASLTGYLHGVLINGASGTVKNTGTIAATGTASTGIFLSSSGYITNASTGLISGGFNGIYANNGPGTVINAGQVQETGSGGSAVALLAGGYISNASTGVISAATAGDAIFMGVFGTGTDATTGDGVAIGKEGLGPGILVNSGQISGPNLGVWLQGGGTVTNTRAGVITAGTIGVFANYVSATVINQGTIDPLAGGSYGVKLAAGGYVSNASIGYIQANNRG